MYVRRTRQPTVYQREHESHDDDFKAAQQGRKARDSFGSIALQPKALSHWAHSNKAGEEPEVKPFVTAVLSLWQPVREHCQNWWTSCDELSLSDDDVWQYRVNLLLYANARVQRRSGNCGKVPRKRVTVFGESQLSKLKWSNKINGWYHHAER